MLGLYIRDSQCPSRKDVPPRQCWRARWRSVVSPCLRAAGPFCSPVRVFIGHALSPTIVFARPPSEPDHHTDLESSHRSIYRQDTRIMPASVFTVKAMENSVSGGVGLNTGISVQPGQLLTVSVDPRDTWSAGPADRTGNANGLGN